MGQKRYSIEYERIEKSFIEDAVESIAHLETAEATRATVTDELTGRSASGAGSDHEEALALACDKLGISLDELEDEIKED